MRRFFGTLILQNDDKGVVMAYSILHEVGVAASPEEIYESLTDARKLAGWWTSDTRGSGAKVGDVLEFWFGGHCKRFKVTRLEPGKLVRWKAVEDQTDDEWDSTEISFSLMPEDAQCYVKFNHSGWKSDKGSLPHCSTKWAVFMLSLKDLLEKGKGRPYPRDIQINHD